MQKASLVIGEALVDEVTDLNGRQERIFGGSPANTALAISRLGVKSFFKGRISLDPTGQDIKNHLNTAGVDVSASIEVSDKALVIEAKIQPDGSAAYFADLTDCSDFGWSLEELDDPLPPGVVVVHLGSLTAATAPGAAAVESWAKEIKEQKLATISFDPNIRPTLVQDAPALKERVERIVAFSDLVKVSHEDLFWLDRESSPAQIAQRWLASGVNAVIVTKAEAGASLFLKNNPEISLPAKKVNLIDTIGAGDTFAAALLAQLIDFNLVSNTGLNSQISIQQWQSLITNSLAAAAITCTRAGANPPTRDEVNW